MNHTPKRNDPIEELVRRASETDIPDGLGRKFDQMYEDYRAIEDQGGLGRRGWLRWLLFPILKAPAMTAAVCLLIAAFMAPLYVPAMFAGAVEDGAPWLREISPNFYLNPRIAEPASIPSGEGYSIQVSNFLSPNPFRGGVMIVNARRHSLVRQYVFDLETRSVIGEARDVWLEAYSETFNAYYGGRPYKSLQSLFSELLDHLGLADPGPQHIMCHLYLLPGNEKSRAKFLSSYQGVPEPGGTAVSPGGRHLRGTMGHRSQFLVDLRSGRLSHLPAASSWEGGWWSDGKILYIGPERNFLLDDISNPISREFAVLGDVETLFTPDDVKAFLDEHGLPHRDLRFFGLVTHWNGSEYEFFVASPRRLLGGRDGERPDPADTWLLKINKERRELEMLYREFPFHRLGRWNADRTLYVFPGGDEAGGTGEPETGAVVVRDTRTFETRTIAEGIPGVNYSSLPLFYGDRIVYSRGDSIWIMDSDGGNRERLFPPAGGNADPPAERD